MKMKLLFFAVAVLLLGCSSNDVKDLDEDNIVPPEEDEVIIPEVEIDNPYAEVDWDKALQIRSTTHIHITDQTALNRAEKLGYRHLPISNYYPSAPYYPIEEMKQGQFRVKQDWGIVKIVNDEPKYIEGPIDWNQLIMDKETGWYDLLTIDQQRQLPFK